VTKDDRLLKTREVCDRLRVSNMTVYALIRDGQLIARRVGQQWRISENSLNKYLESVTETGKENQ